MVEILVVNPNSTASVTDTIRRAAEAVHFVERLRAEVARAFEEQELVEMLDTRIK